MIDRGKFNLLGIQISAVDYETVVDRVVTAANHRTALGVSALAVHGVMTGVSDREHCHRLNQLELVVPDGQPVRWALNTLHRVQLRERVYGPNLMLKVCQAAADAGLPIFFFGSTASTLQTLSKRLLERYPTLQIAGLRASQFRRLTDEERDALVDEIRSSGAMITMVGLGCPRQEIWTYEFKDALSMPVLAVGAAFAFHAGQLAQAPVWMQDRGLEWLYRLGREPLRLWKRYVLLNPAYVALVTLQAARLLTLRPTRSTRPGNHQHFG